MPLNPVLYALLERHFGEVEIRNAGEQMQYDYIFDPVSKRLRLVIAASGEEYAVSCDRCGDTRKRLMINANWYHRDREHGQTWSHLIHCFNEDCYAEHHVRAALNTRLHDGRSSFGSHLAPAARQVSWPLEKPLPILDLPPGFKRLVKLNDSHHAIKYIVGRRFDPEEIDRLYRVGYTNSDQAPRHARRRIIIPSYAGERCVGWQARHVGDIDFKGEDAPPKYYTCPGMKRSRVVYNLDEGANIQRSSSSRGRPTSGASGPWRLRSGAAFLSVQQKELLHGSCRDASVVLMLDPEIMEPISERYARIKLGNLTGMTEAFAGGLALVKLPHGTDPGSLDRQHLREVIKEQAAKQGVQVKWKRLRVGRSTQPSLTRTSAASAWSRRRSRVNGR